MGQLNVYNLLIFYNLFIKIYNVIMTSRIDLAALLFSAERANWSSCGVPVRKESIGSHSVLLRENRCTISCNCAGGSKI